jgi:hypothetical protein
MGSHCLRSYDQSPGSTSQTMVKAEYDGGGARSVNPVTSPVSNRLTLDVDAGTDVGRHEHRKHHSNVPMDPRNRPNSFCCRSRFQSPIGT